MHDGRIQIKLFRITKPAEYYLQTANVLRPLPGPVMWINYSQMEISGEQIISNCQNTPNFVYPVVIPYTVFAIDL